MEWTVLVPVKALPAAKSRLAGFSADADAHARLVCAIRDDTLRAARDAPGVARVVRIGDSPDVEHDLLQHRRGLNAAVAEGARLARNQWPTDGVAALVGDLPALTPAELASTLAAAAEHPTGFVTDAAGTGTTLLTARPGAAFDPRFGPGSAARHGTYAAALLAGPGLRQDVDTADDLRAALRLGVGPHTVAALATAVHADRASWRP
jgi:2-phospho-L-lactate guanylyltransferase